MICPVHLTTFNVLVGSSRRLPTSTSSSDHITQVQMETQLRRLVCEHSDPATLLTLRQVSQPFKQAVDVRIGITSHLPLPEEAKKKLERGPDGRSLSRYFSRRELSTSTNDDDCERGQAMTLEEGWSTDLTTVEAAVRRALSYADPGGQVSWAKYDCERA